MFLLLWFFVLREPTRLLVLVPLIPGLGRFCFFLLDLLPVPVVSVRTLALALAYAPVSVPDVVFTDEEMLKFAKVFEGLLLELFLLLFFLADADADAAACLVGLLKFAALPELLLRSSTGDKSGKGATDLFRLGLVFLGVVMGFCGVLPVLL